MSRFCRNCGTQLNPNAKFCSYCGTQTQDVNYQNRIGEAGPHYVVSQPAAGSFTQPKKRKTGRLKRLFILGIAFITIVIALLIAIPRIFGFTGIDSVTGQPYAGRAVTINGDGFGDYDPENSRVMIDDKDSPIISWGENEVKVIVPAEITAGEKKVMISNPSAFTKKSIKTEFMEHKKTELASVTLSPTEDNEIERDGFTLIVPAGSVAEEKKITIYKYDTPAIDDSPYYTVTDEYEITGQEGGHVFFDAPVFFSLGVQDEEEAMHTSFQIFDEFEGLWVKAETVYVEEEGRVFLSTNHFSGFRKFVSVMYQRSTKVIGDKVAKKVDEAKKAIDYVYKGGKAAKDSVVKLGEEAWVALKDATVEDFVGVTDSEDLVIVYYRVSDAKTDISIPDKAREMAAAFSSAYKEYRDLFGEENVPATKRVVLPSTGSTFTVPDPIRVYIDPRYNITGALAKTATTGNIIMPSVFSSGDLVSTCAHELFHAVQYHQLGAKQLYMATTGLKDMLDNRYTGNETEIYRFFANNKWFFEATAEYAGLFIGSGQGFNAPIHPRIEANRAYYTSNGTHEYGVCSFLDYILATRQSDDRGIAFKEMWNTIIGNYSMMSSVNVAFDGYVQDKLNESAHAAYLNFWREAFTRSYMPEVQYLGARLNISGGVTDITVLDKGKTSSSVDINEHGVGIFRYSFEPKYLSRDKTTLMRSYWFTTSPTTLKGDVYRLDGLEMSMRVMQDPLIGTVNYTEGGLRDVLIPYKADETCGVVAVFYNSVLGGAKANVTLSSTSLKWDNQKEIEKKVSNTTLSRSDKLEFTPVLPAQKAGDPPFTAVVILNNDEDYKTEISKVENGKSFEINAPMKDIPPGRILVNIKIFRDGTLIHEYQSGDMSVMVSIQGSKSLTVELEKDELPYKHNFTAIASPAGEYIFKWDFDNGTTNEDTSKNKSNISSDYNEFKEYEPFVTLYDLNGKQLGTAKVSLIIKEKKVEAASKGGGMDGKWIGYGIYLGYGSPDELSLDITLSISGGQFSMSKSGGGGDSWTGGGSVQEYTDASGEQAYKLVPDTGNNMDDYNFATYFGLERGGLYLEYSDDSDELSLGTTGAKLYFKRD